MHDTRETISIERRGTGYRLLASQVLPRRRSEVFPFFADAANLQQLTPPSLNFRILSPMPIVMRQGAVIEYRLRINRVPIFWRTAIDRWEPPHAFTDRQANGPYAQWEHTHTFTPVITPTGECVRCDDEVLYRLPGPPGLRSLAHAVFVKRQLTNIFRYRAQKMRERFGEPTVGRTVQTPARAQ